MEDLQINMYQNTVGCLHLRSRSVQYIEKDRKIKWKQRATPIFMKIILSELSKIMYLVVSIFSSFFLECYLPLLWIIDKNQQTNWIKV